MRLILWCLAAAILFPAVELAAQPPYLYVSSRNTNSVKRFEAVTGNYVDDIVPPGLNGLNATQEVLFSPAGTLLVTGRGNVTILQFDPDTGSSLGFFTSGYALDNPTKTSLGPDGNLYVSQWGVTQNKVARFDGTSGAFLDEFTSIGLNQGCGHAWDDQGRLYVASFGSADVRRFDTDGTFLGQFTPVGSLTGAVNVWFSEDGTLRVADWGTGSVRNFNGSTGAAEGTFISRLSRVEGFAFGPDGKVYLCDWQLNRINRYDTDGTFLGLFTAQGGMSAPNSLVFGPPDEPVQIRKSTWGEVKDEYR